MASLAPLALTSLVALFLALAAWSFHQWHDKQISLPACEMTYNYNGYIQQTSPLLPNHSGYTLHLYREAVISYGPPGRPNVPVLFIPGNAGRHMQGRSLASECGRQWQRRKAEAAAVSTTQEPTPPVNLDWYMVDTKEQLSAFHGDVLEHQVEFIVACLRYLSLQYRSPGGQLEAGILLVGHSMGGVLARAAAARAAADPQLGPGLVTLLLTLASPHQRPPFPAHPSLHRFYSALEAAPLRDVPMVSLAGGYNDSEVAAALTALEGISPPSLSLHTSLEHIPGVWASAHHNCIVWCNQLVVKLGALLLDMATELQLAAGQQSRGGAGGAGEEQRLAAQQGRNALVVRMTRSALVGAGMHRQLMMPAAGAGSGGEATSSAADGGGDRSGSGSGAPVDPGPDLDLDLDLGRALQRAQAQRRQCRGANLAWYMQYNTPKQVTKPLLQLKHSHIKEGLGKTGKLFHWPLNASGDQAGSETTAASGAAAAARSFALLVSGAKPCSGFRVWLLRSSSVSSSSNGDGGDGLGRDVEVTELLTQLPPLHPAARQGVRIWSESDMVMKGKDYAAASSWVLRLPAPLIEEAAGLVVWLGEVSIKKAFHLTAQLYTEAAAPGVTWLQPYTSAPSPSPSPHRLPLLSQLQLHKPQLPLLSAVSWGRMALRVVTTAAPGGRTAKGQLKKPRTCLHPLLAIPGGPGGPEAIASNLTTFNLAACGAGSAAGGGREASSCSVLLLLDPGCELQEVRLVPDLASLLLETLLQRLALLWALAQALLLLAVCDVCARAAAPAAAAAPGDRAAGAGGGCNGPAAASREEAPGTGSHPGSVQKSGKGDKEADASSDGPALGAPSDGSEARKRSREAAAVAPGLCSSLLHSLRWSGTFLLLLLLLPAAWRSLAHGDGVVSELLRQQFGLFMDSVSSGPFSWLAGYLSSGRGEPGAAADAVAALAVMTAIASFTTGSQLLAVEHMLALAAAAAVTAVDGATRTQEAPAAAGAPAAAAGAAPGVEELLLLLLAATSLVALLQLLLALLSTLLRRCCWGAGAWLLAAARPRRGAGSTGKEGAVHPAPQDTPSAPRQPSSTLSSGAALLTFTLFTAASLLLHEQLVAWACYLLLLLASSAPSPHASAQRRQARAAARLCQSLFLLGAACALPSWLAWVQLQRDSSSAGAGGADWTVGLWAPPAAAALDRAEHLLPAFSALVISYRLLRPPLAVGTGAAGQQRPAPVVAALALMVLRATAKAGLLCAVSGMYWAPHLVQAALALLACLTL